MKKYLFAARIKQGPHYLVNREGYIRIFKTRESAQNAIKDHQADFKVVVAACE